VTHDPLAPPALRAYAASARAAGYGPLADDLDAMAWKATPPTAPTTPAPAPKRPTHVRVTKIGDNTFTVTVGRVYEVVRWYDDGGGAVSPQVMADDGELVELAYVDHSDADYCPSWEPAPCPPPVAGRVVTGHGLPMRDLVASTIYASLGGGGSLDALIPESRRAYLAAADAVLALLPEVES